MKVDEDTAPGLTCKAALAIATFALILTAVAIGTPEWTLEGDITIGLWDLKDNGVTYNWKNKWEYEDFFYSDWMQACRALIMCGIMIGGLGALYNLYVVVRKDLSKTSGRILMIYYLLASFLLLITACVYSACIPQEVNGATTYYKYRGGYGYSLWFCWIGGGIFLVPAGIIYEGGEIASKTRRGERQNGVTYENHSVVPM